MSFWNPDNPLGLPTGSVRAIISVMILAVICYMYVMYQDIPESLQALGGVVLGYYFAQAKG